MEVMKFLFVLLVTVLVLSEAEPTRHLPRCTKIRGNDCMKDKDCACLRNHTSAPLICNLGLKCEVESFYDSMMRRLPCFRVYKISCVTDANCPPCSEAQLICEDNECVREKSMLA